jgi:hypothetical protein
MPSPQALVTFVTTLFILLLATRLALGLPPTACAAIATILALGLAFVVERRIPHEEEEDEDDITQEADADIVRPE